MANPILKIKRGSGAPVSLQQGELAMDLLNKSLFIGTAEGVLAIGGEHVFAKKPSSTPQSRPRKPRWKRLTARSPRT
jgi:hypothetical protein